MPKQYDIIIVGGGAAGFTAGIYAGRRGLKTLIISKDVGGQATLTAEIENYPAVGLVEGAKLMTLFLNDAKKFGAEFITGEVTALKKVNDEFILKADEVEYQAQAVILGFGLTPRDLGVPGEAEYKNKGVFYTALYNSEQYQNKDVIVIGGGNSALLSAAILAKKTHTVSIVHRRDEFRGEDILLKRLKNHKNIKLYLNSIPIEIIGDKTKVKGLKITSTTNTKDVQDLITEAIFVNVGFAAKTKWLGDLVDYANTGHIIIDKHCKTKTLGLFAAGDITDLSYKQVVISAGDGAKAALSAYEYLKKYKGYKGTNIDWGIFK